MNVSAPDSSLWRHADFRRYWGGQAVTVAGFGITAIGIPVIAVVDLHASTMHVALIAVAGKVEQHHDRVAARPAPYPRVQHP
ncbi:hypothetical protein [Streptomyces sp. NPDC048411]|uniref:hypothetical protein n=1 Tax=Streptomyces sp. NPDC048411 TaxID=3157206 RepID=UPI0034565446